MAVIKCENSHYYDSSKYSECPHCKSGTPDQSKSPLGMERQIEDMMTIAKYSQNIHISPQVSKSSAYDNEKTVNMQLSAPSAVRGEEKTVGLFKKTMKMDPVVGWLVCVSGNEKGRDYRIHSGRNFVGRSHKMDICIVDDEGISRENHCSIIYDPKGNTFILMPGEGTSTFLNGEFADKSAFLTENCLIKMGESEFYFVPYCKEGRVWL